MRMLIHLGELVPENMPRIHQIDAGTLVLWGVVIFTLSLLTFGIGAATGMNITFKYWRKVSWMSLVLNSPRLE